MLTQWQADYEAERERVRGGGEGEMVRVKSTRNLCVNAPLSLCVHSVRPGAFADFSKVLDHSRSAVCSVVNSRIKARYTPGK